LREHRRRHHHQKALLRRQGFSLWSSSDFSICH
jgi:hypothetical protein